MFISSFYGAYKGTVYSLEHFSSHPEKSSEALYELLRQKAIIHNLYTSDPLFLSPHYVLEKKSIVKACFQTVNSKILWLEIAKAVAAIVGVILAVTGFVAIAIATTATFSMVLPTACLLFSMTVCSDRLLKIKKIVGKFFFNARHPRFYVGVALVGKKISREATVIGRLRNTRIDGGWLMPVTGLKLTKQMLKSPRTVLINDIAYDALMILKIILVDPHGYEQHFFEGAFDIEKRNGQQILFKHLARLLCLDKECIMDACYAEESLEAKTSLAESVLRDEFLRRYPYASIPFMLKAINREVTLPVFNSTGFPNTFGFAFQRFKELDRQTFHKVYETIAFFMRAKRILTELPESISTQAFAIPLDDLQQMCFRKVMSTLF